MHCLRTAARELLILTDPLLKAQAVLDAPAHGYQVNPSLALAEHERIPGRPAAPRLVSPRAVPQRSLASAQGRTALIHALAHIEFNAINLALDAVWRFADLPAQYYRDWFLVAQEEAKHFHLLHQHLIYLGFDYGSFDAHDGLWEIAQKTKHSALARMALVPRLLEARGLDVSPAIAEKLRHAKDQRAADIVEIILRDEVGHVRIGNHWFQFLCAQQGTTPTEVFLLLLKELNVAAPRPPFNVQARRAAGFTEHELGELLALNQRADAG